jgi:hypothetical protein
MSKQLIILFMCHSHQVLDVNYFSICVHKEDHITVSLHHI